MECWNAGICFTLHKELYSLVYVPRLVAGSTPVGGRVLGVSTEDLQAPVLTDKVVVVSQRDGALILEPGDGGARVPLNAAGQDDAPSLHHREVSVIVLLSVKRVPRGNCQ